MLLQLDSSSSNQVSQNFTTTFNNLILDKDYDYEIALIQLSMNYSYPNVSSGNANNTVEISDNGVTFTSITIPDGNYSIDALNTYIQGQMKTLNIGHSVSNGADVYAMTITPNFNTGLVDIAITGTFQFKMTSSTFHNLLGFNATTLTATNSPHSSTKAVDLTVGITSINVRCSIAQGTYDSQGNNSDIIYAFTPQVSPYSYISERPTNPIYLDINTQSQITNINMRITSNLNKDLDLRGEPVNYLLHLRRKER